MRKRQQTIFLIGPMGSGKSTVGRLAARELGLSFHDCDRDLEARTGASVSLIFDIEGENGFRERESSMLAELAEHNDVLVATGGGAVLRQTNRELMQRAGLVVYLKTSVEQQLRRLRRDSSRPLLQTPDRRARLEKLAAERNPLYESAADLIIPSRNRSPSHMANALICAIRDYFRENPVEASNATD